MTALACFLEFIEKTELDCSVEEVPFIRSTLPEEPPIDPPDVGWSTLIHLAGMVSLRFSADGNLQSVTRT